MFWKSNIEMETRFSHDMVWRTNGNAIFLSALQALPKRRKPSFNLLTSLSGNTGHFNCVSLTFFKYHFYFVKNCNGNPASVNCHLRFTTILPHLNYYMTYYILYSIYLILLFVLLVGTAFHWLTLVLWTMTIKLNLISSEYETIFAYILNCPIIRHTSVIIW